MKRKNINLILIAVLVALLLFLVFYVISMQKNQEVEHVSFSEEYLERVKEEYKLSYTEIDPDKTSDPETITLIKIKESLQDINY
jgi:cell division protein FtsN